MKIKIQFLTYLFVIFSISSFAQGSIRRTTGNIKETVKSVEDAKQTTESAIGLAKSLGGIFQSSGKKGNVVTLHIVGFEYGDPAIRSLSGSLAGKYGKKKVSTGYKSELFSIEVKTKRTGLDIWEALPPELTASFELLEIENESIILQRADALEETK